VAPAALLTRYKGGGEFVPLENREAAPACEVIAERAGIGNRDVQGHRDMMPRGPALDPRGVCVGVAGLTELSVLPGRM
jgi:hypothetical protein